MKIPTKWVLVLLLVSVIGTAAAVITLFTHTFPAVTTVSAILTTTCPTAPLTLSPTSVLSGTSGSIVAKCSASTPAFTVASIGSATPTFTLPTGYTINTLEIFADTMGTATTCPAIFRGGLITLTPFAFIAGDVNTGFDYCLFYNSPPPVGIASFTVMWTQQ